MLFSFENSKDRNVETDCELKIVALKLKLSTGRSLKKHTL